jgi:hypothetical protein
MLPPLLASRQIQVSLVSQLKSQSLLASTTITKPLEQRCQLRTFQSGGGTSATTSASGSTGATGRTSLTTHHHKPDEPQKREFTSINNETPYTLCFLRHGQSTWNRDNRFIGWTDTPLTDDGVLEARIAGKMLANSGILFDEVHTSYLRRCIRTANLVLMEMGQEYIPVHKHWRLNERSYGNLVGKNKKETVDQYGKDQVKRWRRSYDEPPPPMDIHHDYHPRFDKRYRNVSSSTACFVVAWNGQLWLKQ